MARVWEFVGPPLRPSPEDVLIVAGAVKLWIREHGAPRAMILGVTPELYEFLAPLSADVLAVDRNPAMIQTVWAGPPGSAIRADWTRIPEPAASRDIIICDGGLSLLEYPTGIAELVEQCRQILAAGGLCIVRPFVRPDTREEPAAVLADALAGQVPDLNALKLRLWAALQQNPTDGVRVHDVLRTVNDMDPDLESLGNRFGWAPREMAVLEAYRDSPSRYFLPSVSEVSQLFCESPGGFEMVSATSPDYPLGDRCPTVVFRKR
jgi:SAM-dependent methyltransferase